MGFGMPSIGPVDAAPAITDTSFVDTDHAGILFTVGRAWLRSPLVQELGAGGDVRCGNFDIVLGRLSRILQLHATPHPAVWCVLLGDHGHLVC